MIVHWSRRAGGNDQSEETQRAVFRAVQRVLTDAIAHSALGIRPREALRQPTAGGEEIAERGLEGVNSFVEVNDACRALSRRIDERANLRCVDEEAETLVRVIVP
jgi:hypothetical protein